MSLEQFGKYTFLAPAKVCLGDLNKDVFLKSKMKNVVKYDVYWDILHVGSIYVTKYTLYVFLQRTPKSPSSCKPRHPGLGTGMGGSNLAVLSPQRIFRPVHLNTCSHLVWHDRRVRFRALIKQSAFCSINGHLDTMFKLQVSFWTSGTCL